MREHITRCLSIMSKAVFKRPPFRHTNKPTTFPFPLPSIPLSIMSKAVFKRLCDTYPTSLPFRHTNVRSSRRLSSTKCICQTCPKLMNVFSTYIQTYTHISRTTQIQTNSTLIWLIFLNFAFTNAILYFWNAGNCGECIPLTKHYWIGAAAKTPFCVSLARN